MSGRRRKDPVAAPPVKEAEEAPPEKTARKTSTRFAELGPALRLLRRQRKIRAFDVAKALGIDLTMINRWEAGTVAPSLENLGRLVDYYDLHLGDLDDLLAFYADRPRVPRPAQPPRTAAEAEALAQALAPPPPPRSTEADGNAGYRQILRTVLLQLVPRNGSGSG